MERVKMTCGTCLFFIKGDCHRYPPPYPKVEEWTIGCGEHSAEGRASVSKVGPAGIMALIDRARGKGK